MPTGPMRAGQSALERGMQARADRHNQSLPPEIRQSQYNQDWDHYLVGNEMAGPQFPLHERLGAIAPAIGHEIVRPLISGSPALTDTLNKLFGTPSEPVWISEGAGAGGAAAEPPVGVGGALRNLSMLYQGATLGRAPDDEAGKEVRPGFGLEESEIKPTQDKNLVRSLLALLQGNR